VLVAKKSLGRQALSGRQQLSFVHDVEEVEY
jgi:hypothetical protein